VSDTYLLSAPDNRYALRIYRSTWRTREAILEELAVLEHLNNKGVAVAMPIPRRDGELITAIHAPEGLRHAVLFHWAGGRAPKYTDPAHAREYGRLLGKLHVAGDDLTLSSLRPCMDADWVLERPLERIRTRLRNMPTVAADLDALSARTRDRLNRASNRLCDWGLCHGDVWTNNARIDGNRLVMLDFDFCGPGWRLFDLASYRWHARLMGVEEAAWKPFIEGYLQVRPAGADSLGFIRLFMILRHLWTTAHFINRGPETGALFLPDEDLEKMVPFCEAIELEEHGEREKRERGFAGSNTGARA
jgi:Ser/Thr protein kinase RdoA (MazF antagonist)